MAELRFVYDRSSVYGWCVYDKQLGMMPAYSACDELLPRVKPDTCESPVLLKNEYAAMRLCSRLNNAWRRKNNVQHS